MRNLICIIVLLSSFLYSQKYIVQVNGKVVNKSDRSGISNCNITIRDHSIRAVTDSSGFFRLSLLHKETYLITFSFVGFRTVSKELQVPPSDGDLYLEIEMEPLSIEGKEVTVSAPRQKADLERYRLEKQDIKNIPNLYSDAMRSIQLIAGVTSNNELSSGYNVHGGNFDENLIYLNGYEIYRPFLLRQGVEENQSAVNSDLVEEMKFYGNGFSAAYGDKMSSAAEFNYKQDFEEKTHGSFRADLTNLSAMVNRRVGNINISGAIRYAYPGLFLNYLHTTGSYRPFYFDVQAYIDYKVNASSNINLFIVSSQNKFKFSPYEFRGNLQRFIDDSTFKQKRIEGIKINFEGNKDFEFSTNMAGLRWVSIQAEKIKVTADAFFYQTHETEESATSSDFYYSFDPYFEDSEAYYYLKSELQKVNNLLKMTSGQVRLILNMERGYHSLESGISLKASKISNGISEEYSSRSKDFTIENPYARQISTGPEFNSIALYLQDDIKPSDYFRVNAGIRYLRYEYSDENLVSPRIALYYLPSKTHTLSFNWGYYYQPPFYYEIRNKQSLQEARLKSQRAVNYSMGWEYFFREKVKFQMQAYYKDLKNLISYYVDQMNLEYGNDNSMEGYAFGADLQFQGEITKNTHSWISYSYLNTGERKANSGQAYQRRFVDQTHTVQLFLQDKFARYPNFQSHLKIIFGSGFLFPVKKAAADPRTGQMVIVTDLNDRRVYPFYMRADMGLSYDFNVFTATKIRLKFDVMNVFNKQNIAGYIWFNTIKELKHPFWSPQMYSQRFFNLGAELTL